MATSNEELGVFLRSRRASVTPAEVGLPPGTRRRVPGLRREEVAVLANVGTTWYTWLEQGRAVQPSIAVLQAIADALLLSHAERAHLFRLAGYTAAADHAGESAISDRLRTTLDQLSPFPAMVTTRSTSCARTTRPTATWCTTSSPTPRRTATTSC